MSTVGKAMTVLEAFSAEAPEMGLSELARAVGFDKATTLRLLKSLMQHGVIEQILPGKTYRIGPAVQRFARLRASSLPLLDAARPALERLCDETGESCHVSQASGAGLATVLASHCGKAMRINFTIGESMPFHCTASGVAYLAFANPSLLEQVIRGPMPKITSKSKTKAAELRAHVAEAQKRGYAINAGEFDPDAVSVAAPILAQEGFSCAAISVAAPASRVSGKLIAHHGACVVQAARDITVALGGPEAGLTR